MADLLNDGMTRVAWLPAVTSISAPDLSSDFAAAVELTDLITPDGLNITPDTAAVDNSSLASTFTTSKAGRRSFTIALTCKVTDGTGGGLAKQTLLYQAAGFLVVRRGVAEATAWAAAQVVEVYPVECGEPAKVPPAPNEVQKFTVPMYLTADPDTDAAIAA